MDMGTIVDFVRFIEPNEKQRQKSIRFILPYPKCIGALTVFVSPVLFFIFIFIESLKRKFIYMRDIFCKFLIFTQIYL